MATALSESGLEEGEYDSDSDGTSALALRRRQASDDEDRELPLDAVSSADDDDEEDDDDASPHSFSDDEVEGTAPDGEGEAVSSLSRRRRLVTDEDDDHEGLHQEDGSRGSVDPEDGAQGTAATDAPDSVEPAEEEKKEAEPFVVPTAGAFYMHDDRFRGVAGARPRRGVGGSRKLWEAKDEKPWVHDLFEELNMRDDSYRDDGSFRGGRGRSRARGRASGDRHRGWVGKLASDSEELNINRARRGRGKGRPVRSEGADHSRADESGFSATKGTQENTASTNSEGQDENIKHEFTAPPRKVGAGSLNSASPPFFPSSAIQPKTVEGSESNPANVQRSTKGRDRGTKASSQVFVAKSGASGGSGRGLHIGALHSSPQSQQPVMPSTNQTTTNMRNSSNQSQPPLVPSVQPQSQQAQAHETQGPGAVIHVSAASSPANLGQSVQPARLRSTGGRGGRGANAQVVGGRGGPYAYHGGASTGMNNVVQKVDPGFAPPIPGVGPVAVQYGGHSPAGMPLPAVGMAMPNYSGQPQFGFPNSEVTWIPVLAGGGTIGAGYATPYMTMEGTPPPMYFSQPAPQPPSFRPTGNGSKPGGLWKPPPNQELGSDEFGHRQSKPRRYSEMNFGQ